MGADPARRLWGTDAAIERRLGKSVHFSENSTDIWSVLRANNRTILKREYLLNIF
jgi:hypothetical protein